MSQLNNVIASTMIGNGTTMRFTGLLLHVKQRGKIRRQQGLLFVPAIQDSQTEKASKTEQFQDTPPNLIL